MKKVRTTPQGKDAAPLDAASTDSTPPGLIWALAAPGAASGGAAQTAAQRVSAFMPWTVGKDGKATIAISAQE